MLCEKCKKKQATTYIKQVVNGKVTEMNLCPDCAAEMHIHTGSIFGNHLFGAQNSILSGLFGNTPTGLGSTQTQVCPQCGTSLNEISSSGRVGCANCYTTFREYLRPTIQRIHGKVEHEGKIPSDHVKEMTTTEKIDLLKKQMSEAVEQQNFEQAATLRDQIRDLEEKGE